MEGSKDVETTSRIYVCTQNKCHFVSKLTFISSEYVYNVKLVWNKVVMCSNERKIILKVLNLMTDLNADALSRQPQHRGAHMNTCLSSHSFAGLSIASRSSVSFIFTSSYFLRSSYLCRSSGAIA